jgi:hypothetical protein
MEVYLRSLILCFPIGFHFLAYPNLFGIKGFVVVVVVKKYGSLEDCLVMPSFSYETFLFLLLLLPFFEAFP